MTQFWIKKPSNLIGDSCIFPTKKMSENQKLNAISRLFILMSLILLFVDWRYSIGFAVISMIVVLGLYHFSKKEGFTITPTYASTDLHQTTVPPLFAEEWQVKPPSYDIYSSISQGELVDSPKTTSMLLAGKSSYPYGQYLSPTNLLPSDERYLAENGNGGAKSAREYANSAFVRNEIAYRDNMTRILKKKLANRFRHNSNDTFSPYHSF